jgi:fumarate hydratase class II
MDYRIEKDTMGEVKVPSDKLWGAQTQRSLENFRIGDRMPGEIITAFAYLKKAAAMANNELGVLDDGKRWAICKACDEILQGKLDEHFPLVVFQTGSGTQTNMNVNEVVANRAEQWAASRVPGADMAWHTDDDEIADISIHPNDDVNKSQSSNDTFPTAMSVAAVINVEDRLIPAIDSMIAALKALEDKAGDAIKTGRTHLQDAVAMTFAQEVSGWRSGFEHSREYILTALEPLRELALGGTAVGTGLNAPEGFDIMSAAKISDLTGKEFRTAENKFHALSLKDAFVFEHGALKALAADLMKVANDIRWLASGPRCGLGEITIPANEPGSSIMPGKVNPTQCEAATMTAVRVMGNDAAIGIAASQGNFELNVFMPVMADSFLESVRILAESISSLDKNCVSGIEVNADKMLENAEKSLMTAAALNPHIGYEKAAEVAKKAHAEGLSLKEAGVALGVYSGEEYDEWISLSEIAKAGK